jgi:hydroxymethylbilane synthase
MVNVKPIFLATRGSALALAQTNMILAQCRAAMPAVSFEVKIIKTTGDKLQTAAPASQDLPKGLFTKELEAALLKGEADLAVHSLKDLPTELPAGLKLGATTKRADVRDALIYREASNPAGGRGFKPHLRVAELPAGAAIATSSNRRAAQLLERRPDLKIVPIRGNVTTRLKKLARQPDLDALVLAAAGLDRLNFKINAAGALRGDGVPGGLLLRKLEPEEMLPCVGQAAIGLEVREHDERAAALCAKLNHEPTFQCVTAERALLQAMGGGCQVPLAAYAEIAGQAIRMRAVSYLGAQVRRAEGQRPLQEARALGEQLAAELKGK